MRQYLSSRPRPSSSPMKSRDLRCLHSMKYLSVNWCPSGATAHTSPHWRTLLPCTVARPPLIAERQNKSRRFPCDTHRESTTQTSRSNLPPLAFGFFKIVGALMCAGAPASYRRGTLRLRGGDTRRWKQAVEALSLCKSARPILAERVAYRMRRLSTPASVRPAPPNSSGVD